MIQFDLFDEKTNHILAAPDYEEFKKRLLDSNCQRCTLHQSRTNVVVDRGVPDTKIMVIGEAPGQHEDQQGKAFVGRSGQLFDKVMESIGLDTNRDMLIANIVKSRPPDNRKPTAEEAAACMPYLQKQISLVKPKVILLLGATSLQYMEPQKKGTSMGEIAGEFLEIGAYPGIRFMVLYHPAALLRMPRLKADMWEHVKKLKRHLESEGLMPQKSQEQAGAKGRDSSGAR